MVIPFCRKAGCFNNATCGVWCYAHKPADFVTPAAVVVTQKADRERRKRTQLEAGRLANAKLLERWARGDRAEYLAEDFGIHLQTVRNRVRKYATPEQRARRAAAVGGKKGKDNERG